jgi:hypothetical protein
MADADPYRVEGAWPLAMPAEGTFAHSTPQ